MNTADLTIWLVVGAGILSFVSPCSLPLYPSYLSYITGVSIQDLKENRGMMQKTALMHTLFFIIGFSIIFYALGLSVSWIGVTFSSNQRLLQQIGGIFIIVMGLFMTGLIQPKWLMSEKKFHYKSKSTGYIRSIFVGMTYAAGWTPCVGPIFSAVLMLGATNPDEALLYITAYTLGFAVPFFVMAFFIGKVKWIVTYASAMMKIGGSMMILTGILLYTNQMTKITAFFIRLFDGFTGF
ncbi:cytochrome c biogenesis CcdA family protein [Bacillus pseudomycoides]|uniref:cytochrome c biogenesis CcdA family protein n=1 Tax=Bacillus pseudomycoides TaxID=64104 RepID=UPI001FB33ED0|nr:cytochrome c biogenesis protein CcdA [Bacillus pseudomycoides]